MISIVIPVYNAAPYIADCLESILCQDYDDYEIIIVNDGSTDDSLEICNEYEKRSNKIKVLSQKNSGQNAAIKKGLSNVNGEYVCFVDSDDWIESKMLVRFVKAIEKYNPDCIICRTCRDNELDKPSQLEKKKEYYNRQDIEREIFPSLFCNLLGVQETSISNSRIAKLYKVSKLNRILPYMIETVRLGEDSLQSKPYILLCESICFLNDILYHYRRNNSSVSRNNTNCYTEMKVVIDTLRKASKDLSDYDFTSQFNAMTLNAGHEFYTQTVYTMKTGRRMYLQLKELCLDPYIEEENCPQQSNKYSQLEIKAISKRDYKSLFLLAVGRKIIHTISRKSSI